MAVSRLAPSSGEEGHGASDRVRVEAAVARRLVAAGKIDETALDRAERLRNGMAVDAGGDRLAEILVRLGLAREADVVEAMAAELGCEPVRPAEFPETPLLEGASPKFLREARVLPIADGPEGIVLAAADPLDSRPAQAIRVMAGRPVSVRPAAASDIEIALDRLYGGGRGAFGAIVDEIDGVMDAGPQGENAEDDVSRLRDLASEAPVIRLVNALIARGIENRASDIHVEPLHDRLLVRYRVDGVLRDGATPPARLKAAVVSRIKIMAKLNIAERRLPQDGRIRVAVRGKDYDLRVATVPTLHGEAVTMRILDRSSLVEDFRLLGFRDETLARYLPLLGCPQGILLVTGPTGSGKTTTLYTSLMRLNTPDRKIFTVEDPIEYQLERVNQVQVRANIKLNFAEILRTLLRHNPDIIMIGEMRDFETAQIAIQSALTGHLVLSTLHTNDAASSITRLLDMKVEDYLVTSTVNGVMAQRLVRRLCLECRRPHKVLPEFIERLGMLDLLSEGAEPVLFEPGGCTACRGTGYAGQIAVIEVLVVSDAIRRLILRHAEAGEIRAAAVEEGMRTMYRDGLLKALDGVTTVEEILRVAREA